MSLVTIENVDVVDRESGEGERFFCRGDWSESHRIRRDTGEPVRHPQVREYFQGYDSRRKSYRPRDMQQH